MFTVKATYRGQTRKITFPNLNAFPTFEQLCNQLYRVFPISQNYYLSKLLFSPDAANTGRILIAKEVHSSEEYAQCLASLTSSSWANALLRFSVYEETPHKLPGVSSANPMWSAYSTSSSTVDLDNGSPLSTIIGNGIGLPVLDTPAPITSPIPPPPPPPMSFFVPPPPIIYSSSPRALAQAPMEIDSAPSSFCRTPQLHHQPPPSPPPCACAEGKKEIQSLLTSFQADLDKILTNTFGSPSVRHNVPSPSPLESAPPGMPIPPLPQMQPAASGAWSCLSHWCDTCMKRFDGAWYACSKCPLVQCSGCQSLYPNSHLTCLNSPNSVHSFARRTCSNCPDVASYPAGFVPSGAVLAPIHPASLTSGLSLIQQSPQPPLPSPYQYHPGPTGCHPIYTPALPITSAFVPPTPSIASPRPPPDAPSMPCVLPPEATPEAATIEPLVTVPSAPPIHRGIICDSCNKTIEGIRHKCLDCSDYDLCTTCITTGSAERHNPFHEFFEIAEPGRVIVHTVFTGEGEREAVASHPPPPAPASTSTGPEAPEPVLHPANCDLCDSRIRGPRFKCLDCPDFDTCGSCYSIVDEHHPQHSFVSITEPSQFIRRPVTSTVRHYATCDSCQKGINGIRYKCMHASCPDFDLCQNCEALPIPVHPPNHPLLKMRSAETIVPTVYRVGQARMVSPVPSKLSLEHHTTVPVSQPMAARSSSTDARHKSITVSPGPRHYILGTLPDSTSPALSYRSFESHSPVAPYSPPRSPALSIPGGFDSPSASPVRLASPVFNPIHLESPVFNPIQLDQDFITADLNNGSASHLSLNLFPALEPALQPMSIASIHAIEQAHYIETQPIPHHSPQNPSLEVEARPQSPPTVPNSLIAPSRPLETAVADPSSRFTSGRQTPNSNIPSESSTTSGPTRSSNFKLPPLSLDSGSDLLRELWPRVAQEFNHLLSLQNQAVASSGNAQEFNPVFQTQAAAQGPSMSSDSPLTGEALLSRPLPSSAPDDTIAASNQSANALSSLAALLNARAVPPSPASPPAPVPAVQDVTTPLVVKLPDSRPNVEELLECKSEILDAGPSPKRPIPGNNVPLHATFIDDVTVPDGQVFPPGAEFVKSWKILNDSEQPWPEKTELVFVAGETLSRFPFIPKPVLVGSVAANTEVELSTGELKAPEGAGRYVSYWRLKDGNGELFGDSIWIDIIVREASSLSTSEAVSPASSIIVPSKAQSSPSITQGAPAVEKNLSSVSSSVSLPPSSGHSLASDNEEEVASDAGSVASSASLISAPSSSSDDFDDDEDDEAVVWEDSRSHFSNERLAGNLANMEYVLLFDESSSEEEL